MPREGVPVPTPPPDATGDAPVAAALSEAPPPARPSVVWAFKRLADAVAAWWKRPSRSELAARLARCEEMLGGLHVEEGFLFARGLGVVDAAGDVRFAARVDKEGTTRVDLYQGPGEANVALCTNAVSGPVTS